jgi:uncharacterized surface protein with fasciclin (FAS1) repeats
MRIRTIGVVGLIAAFALFAGADAAQAKAGSKHSGKSHSKMHKQCNDRKCKDEQCGDMSFCAKKGCHHAGSVLYKKSNCKTELNLMMKAGMCKVLCGKGPITVFCPTDEAYSKLGKARLDDIKNDPKKLANMMKYHVLNKKLMTGDLKANGGVPTSEGESLITNIKDGKAEVDGCIIIEQDIPCSNGVIQIIDDVPIPERGK